MNRATPAQLAFIINDCLEAVDRSNVGPLMMKDASGNQQKDMMGNPILNNLAFNTFMQVLNSQLQTKVFNDIKEP